MRVSTDQLDPGFATMKELEENGSTVQVYLDGVLQPNVITACPKAGAVKRYKLDRDGYAQIDPLTEAQPWVETVTGRVEVRVVEREAA
jgi:hypothetical protein